MTTVNVSRSLLRKVIAHFADSIHEFRENETAPDGSIEIEAQEMIESEEKLLAELRQALVSAEQPAKDDEAEDMEAIGRAFMDAVKRNEPNVSWGCCPTELYVRALDRAFDAEKAAEKFIEYTKGKLDCGHTIGDLIYSPGSATKCGACVAAKAEQPSEACLHGNPYGQCCVLTEVEQPSYHPSGDLVSQGVVELAKAQPSEGDVGRDKFVPCDTYGPDHDTDNWVAGITHLRGADNGKDWYQRIEVYGDTKEAAEAMRDKIIAALNTTTPPQEPVACAIRGCRPDPRCGEEECVNCERTVCTDHVAEYSSEDGDDPICVECKNPIDALMGIIENANVHNARVVEAARGRIRALTNYGQTAANDEAVRLLRSIRNRLRGGNETGAAIVDEIDDFLATHKQEEKGNG